MARRAEELPEQDGISQLPDEELDREVSDTPDTSGTAANGHEADRDGLPTNPRQERDLPTNARQAQHGKAGPALNAKNTLQPPGQAANPASKAGGASGGASNAIGGAKADDSLKTAAAKTGAQIASQNYAGAALSVVRNKKTRNIALIAVSVPIIIGGLMAFFFLNILANPFEFIKNVVTDKPTRRFAIQAAEAVGVPGASAAKELNERLGYAVPLPAPNTAFAAEPTNKPLPGSIDEIIANIDWQKAQWQFGNSNTCNYTFTFTPYVNYDHKTIHQIDKVFQKGSNQEIPLNQADLAVNTCFMNGYPLFNLSTRNKTSTSVNKFSDSYRSYVTDKSQVDKLDQTQADQELLEKTVQRIVEKLDDAPQADAAKIKEVATQLYGKIEQGENLYDPAVLPDSFWQGNNVNFPTDQNNPDQVAQALCPYTQLFANPDNLIRGVESRRSAAVRDGMKFLSLSGSGALYKNSNKETNYTMDSIANWANSAGYSLAIGEGEKGEPNNPESIHNASYLVDPYQAYAVNQRIIDMCGQYNFESEGAFQNFLGNIKQLFTRSTEPSEAILQSYNILRQDIVNASDGRFTSVDDFGMKELLISSFYLAATGTVTGLEDGPNNYNRQTMGVEQLTHDYLRTVGGRYLNEAESAELAIKVENDARREQQDKSMLARLFDTTSPRSIVSRLASQNTSPGDTQTYVASIAKSVTTPVQNLASILHNAAFVATGQNNRAFAVGEDLANYFKIQPVGFSAAELNSVNMLENARAIEALKREIDETDDIRIKQMRYYDECMKKDISSPVYFSRVGLDDIDYDDNGQPILPPQNERVKYLYIKSGFEIGGTGTEIVLPDQDRSNPNTDSDFFKVYTCETMLTNTNPLGLGNINLDLAKRYRLYTYYKAQMTMLRNLSGDKAPEGFYAGPGNGSGGSGGKNPGGFIWPVGTKTGISRCADGNPSHTYPSGGKAIDIYWQPGSGGPYPDIYAVADGEIIHSGPMGGYGNAVMIKHADDLFTLYAHNQELLVQVGDTVSQGDAIAKGDSTGNSSGNHLHFEVGDNKDNRTFNPGEWLPDQDNVRALCGVQ